MCGLWKNVAGQIWHVFAFNRLTGVPVTGDADNITANLRIDGGDANPIDDEHPTELEGGYYYFDLTQAETNGDQELIAPSSTTTNVQVIGVLGVTFPQTVISPVPSTVTYSLVDDLYCSRDEMEAVFGPVNVAKWADLDDDEDPDKITARINWAISWAANEINDFMRGGFYVIPLMNVNKEVPLSIVNVAATLAGVWLYERRGVEDFDPESGNVSHRLAWHKNTAYQLLAEIKRGTRKIEATQQSVKYPQ